MRIPFDWLKDYVDMNGVNIDELRNELGKSNIRTPIIEKIGHHIEDVITGRIEQITEHPVSDELMVYQVNIGGANPKHKMDCNDPQCSHHHINDVVLTLVTDVQTLKIGDLIPVVLKGSELYESQEAFPLSSFSLETEVRIVKAQELGLASDVIPDYCEKSVIVMEDQFPVGSNFVEVLALKSTVMEVVVPDDRPDCMHMTGLAREIAKNLNRNFRKPYATVYNEVENIDNYINLKVSDPKSFDDFAGRVVKDVKIKNSPWWLQKKLMLAGIKPVNNILDVANYVMFEYGLKVQVHDLNKFNGTQLKINKTEDSHVFLSSEDSDMKIDFQGQQFSSNAGVDENTTTIVISSSNICSENTHLPTCSHVVSRVCKLIEYLESGNVIGGVAGI